MNLEEKNKLYKNHIMVSLIMVLIMVIFFITVIIIYKDEIVYPKWIDYIDAAFFVIYIALQFTIYEEKGYIAGYKDHQQNK